MIDDPLALLDAGRLADLLGCSRRTIYARWADGRLPYLDGPSGRTTPRRLLAKWQRAAAKKAPKQEPDVLAQWRAGLPARRGAGRRQPAAAAPRKQTAGSAP